jgi:hypothetical protein
MWQVIGMCVAMDQDPIAQTDVQCLNDNLKNTEIRSVIFNQEETYRKKHIFVVTLVRDTIN